MWYTFDIAEHEEYGGLGLRLANRPHFEPLQGMGAAHDIMEHFSDDNGGTEGECEAFGAMILVRCMGGYFERNGGRMTGEQVVASGVLCDMWMRLSEFGFKTDPPTNQKIDEDDEEMIDRITKDARQQIIEEVDDDEEISELELDSFLVKVKAFMIKGYLKALKKYKNWSYYDLASVFSDLEEKLEQALAWGEEGQQVKVNFIPSRLWYEVRLIDFYGKEYQAI